MNEDQFKSVKKLSETLQRIWDSVLDSINAASEVINRLYRKWVMIVFPEPERSRQRFDFSKKKRPPRSLFDGHNYRTRPIKMNNDSKITGWKRGQQKFGKY